MNTVLVYFKNSYTVILLAVILSVIFTAVYALASESEISTNKDDYLKAIALSSLTTALIIYINSIPGNLAEEVITGIAPF
jgi:ABC-type sulfate transport system permease subunit